MEATSLFASLTNLDVPLKSLQSLQEKNVNDQMETNLRIEKSEEAAAQLMKEIQLVKTKLALSKSEYENKNKDL